MTARIAILCASFLALSPGIPTICEAQMTDDIAKVIGLGDVVRTELPDPPVPLPPPPVTPPPVPLPPLPVSPPVPPPTHVPEEQISPTPHAVLQSPQCEVEVSVSVQVPAHRVCPAGQAHVPSTQDCPPVHAFPQLPQFDGSVLVETQIPPHAV